MEYEIITATRQIRWVLERGVGVYDETGNLLFLEGYIEDVTGRKMYDKELLQAKEKAEESDSGSIVFGNTLKEIYFIFMFRIQVGAYLQTGYRISSSVYHQTY